MHTSTRGVRLISGSFGVNPSRLRIHTYAHAAFSQALLGGFLYKSPCSASMENPKKNRKKRAKMRERGRSVCGCENQTPIMNGSVTESLSGAPRLLPLLLLRNLNPAAGKTHSAGASPPICSPPHPAVVGEMERGGGGYQKMERGRPSRRVRIKLHVSML